MSALSPGQLNEQVVGGAEPEFMKRERQRKVSWEYLKDREGGSGRGGGEEDLESGVNSSGRGR